VDVDDMVMLMMMMLSIDWFMMGWRLIELIELGGEWRTWEW
jgi:hypothetical protein